MHVNRNRYSHSRRGYTIRDLLATLTGLVLLVGLLVPVLGANRDLGSAAVCKQHLQSLFEGLVSYTTQYNSFPPHSPGPPNASYWPQDLSEWPKVDGLPLSGFDPQLGWILTYGLGLEPPGRFSNGHFQWFGLEVEELPEMVKCPAADYHQLFEPNPEIHPTAALESFVYRYAAFYQTSGVCRAATPSPIFGGIYRNPLIPDPRNSNPLNNFQGGGPPAVWVGSKTFGDPYNPTFDSEALCYIQAIHPAEVQSPARLYFLADSREYKPSSMDNWAPAAINDGWLTGWGNQVFLGSRHFGYANVLYLDGHVTRDGLTHSRPQWHLDYDADTNPNPQTNRWRISTFTTDLGLANLRTQVHLMPVLMVKGWEPFFNENGAVPPTLVGP